MASLDGKTWYSVPSAISEAAATATIVVRW